MAPPQNNRSDKFMDTKKRPGRRTSSPTIVVRLLIVTLRLNKNDRMLFLPSKFKRYEHSTLLDTGALQSGLFENKLRRKIAAHPSARLFSSHRRQKTGCQRHYRTSLHTSHTLRFRGSTILRRTIHGTTNKRQCIHWNVVFEKILSYIRFEK